MWEEKLLVLSKLCLKRLVNLLQTRKKQGIFWKEFRFVITVYQTKNFTRFNLEAFTHDRLDMNQKLKSDFGRIENIAGNGENAGYQHFLLFSQCFQKVYFFI